jgi:hypothetical protein
MDISNTLHLKQGFNQNFLRLECQENDNLIYSGVEFVLDNAVPNDILLSDAKHFISVLKMLEDPTIKYQDTKDGGTDIVITERDTFSCNIGLSDTSIIYRQFGSNKKLIEQHDTYISNGIISQISSSKYESLQFIFTKEHFTKIKKAHTKNDFLLFIISDESVKVSNRDRTTNNGYTLKLSDISEQVNLEFILSFEKLSKMSLDSYNVTVYYFDGDVKLVSFYDEGNNIRFVPSILEE